VKRADKSASGRSKPSKALPAVPVGNPLTLVSDSATEEGKRDMLRFIAPCKTY